MKKILLVTAAIFILLFGGLAIFINTKSDFIIQKVSEIVEKNLDAKLEMEKLPSISFFPSLAVSAEKSSLTAKNYTITFEKAAINISLFKLLSGTVHINSVNIDTLNAQYTVPANDKKTQEKTSKANDTVIKKEENTSQDLEKVLALIPAEISITNSNIYYQDENQKLALENINAQIEDFGINKNSSINLKSTVSYKNSDPAAKQDIALDIDTSTDFLFMGQALEYTVKNLTITPLKGVPFSKELNISAESSMDIATLMIEKLDAQITSPFGDINIQGKGYPKETNLNIKGTINTAAIEELITPASFNNFPKTIPLTASLVYNPDKITVNDLILTLHKGLVNVKGSYDLGKQDIKAKIYAENLLVNDYLPKNTEKAGNNEKTADNGKNSEKKTEQNKQKTNVGSKLTFNLTADAKNMQYNALIIESMHSVIDGKISDKETIINISPLTVVSNNDTVNATARLELAPKDLITVSLDAPSLQASHWSKVLAEKAPLEALISAKSNISFKSADPLNTLNGSANIDGKDIQIHTKLLPFITNLLQLDLKLADTYEFTALKAPLTFKNGLMSTTNSYVDSSAVLVNANGTSHLGKNTVNMQGNAELKKQGLIFPYKVTGSLDNPKISLDLGKQLLILGTGILHTGEDVGSGAKDIAIDGGKLIERGLGKLFGK